MTSPGVVRPRPVLAAATAVVVVAVVVEVRRRPVVSRRRLPAFDVARPVVAAVQAVPLDLPAVRVRAAVAAAARPEHRRAAVPHAPVVAAVARGAPVVAP